MARIVPLFLTLVLTAAAQTSAPTGAAPRPPVQPATTGTTSNIAATLPQLQRAAENARVNLARLRVERWKADSAVKQQTESNIDSLQRNLSGALPTLITAAQQNPSSLNASFKLYRNLNVLYDVLGNVAESAGAFGAREEYAALAQDLNNLDTARRSLADAMDTMTAQRDADLQRIQPGAQRAQGQTTAAPPKKIVIDDTEPAPTAKKTAPKKKKTTTTTSEAPKQ